MKFRLIYLITILILAGCSSIGSLSGKSYKYKSKRRILELKFENDSLCTLENTFKCKDLKPELQKILIKCKYNRINDTIFIQNIEFDDGNVNYDIAINVPTQENSKCKFLNEKNRRKGEFQIGPSYQTQYEKHGLVPNIDLDTLYIVKNHILLLKQNERRSIGFIFK